MPKTYPLEVAELRELDDFGSNYLGSLMGVYSKGHHDRERFCQAAREFLGELLEDDAPAVKDGEARQETWRTTPVGPDAPGIFRFDQATPGTPGAYPVTVVYL
jgi:hypothetical protein